MNLRDSPEVDGWFELPWKDSRNAAALVVDLGRLCLRKSTKRTPWAPIKSAFTFIDAYVEDRILSEPLPNVSLDYTGEDLLSRIYYTAIALGREAQTVPSAFIRRQDLSRNDFCTMLAAGEIANAGCEIVAKWAANSLGSNHVPNGMAFRAVHKALNDACIDPDVVEERVMKWRFRDALNGAEPTEELRLAFQAAWEIGQYAFSYFLLAPLPEDAQTAQDPDS